MIEPAKIRFACRVRRTGVSIGRTVWWVGFALRGAAGISICGAALAVPISEIAAQAVPKISAGQWVRVSTKFEGVDPDWMLAQVADLTPSYLVLDQLGSGRLAIMRESLTQLQLFRGWVSRAGRGTVVGAAAGLLASVAVMLTTDCSAFCLAGVPAGALLGRTIGTSTSGYRWSAVPLDELDAAFTPRRVAAVLLGATIAF
jgi:hypothetical protein